MTWIDLSDTYDELSQTEKESLKDETAYKRVVQECLPVFKEEIIRSNKFQEICKVPTEIRVQILHIYLTVDRAANIVKWFRHKDTDNGIKQEGITSQDYYISFQKFRRCLDEFDDLDYNDTPTSKEIYLDGLQMHGAIMTALELLESCNVIANTDEQEALRLDVPNVYTDITQEEKDLLINSLKHQKIQICLNKFQEAIVSSDKFQQICKVPSQSWIQSLRTYFNTDRTANLMKLHEEGMSAYDYEVLDTSSLSIDHNAKGFERYAPWKDLIYCFEHDTKQDEFDNLPEQQDYYLGGLSLHAMSMLALDLIEACRAVGDSNTIADGL